MKITGSYYSSLFDQKTDQVYTQYLDNTKKNRLFQNALIESVSDIYEGKQDQKAEDELSVLITTGIVLSVINNNQFYTAALALFNVTNVGTTVTITTLLPHNIVSGNTIIVSGITGFATNNPNGTFVVVTTPTATTLTFVAGAAPTGAYTTNSGIMYLQNGQLIDYSHALAVQCLYNKTIYSLGPVSNVITNASNTTPIRLTFGYYNNLRNQQIKISGITGNTNANGTFYLKKVNELQGDLYSDINYQTPVAGNGTFGGTPVMSLIYNNYARKLNPDEKISPSSKGTDKDPRFLVSDKMLKISPSTSVCSQVTIDYIKVPLNVYGNGIFIDSNDNVLDLTLYYSEKFLDLIMEKAVKLMAIEAASPELYQLSSAQSQQNT